MSSRDPALMHPLLQAKWIEFHDRCEAAEIDVFLIQTFRTSAEQQALWNKGRDKDGNIIDQQEVVTHARPGESPHECLMPDGTPSARAFDFAIRLGDGELDWDADDDDWQTVIQIGKTIGLESGYYFPRDRIDPDHMQLANWKNL